MVRLINDFGLRLRLITVFGVSVTHSGAFRRFLCALSFVHAGVMALELGQSESREIALLCMGAAIKEKELLEVQTNGESHGEQTELQA